MTDPNPLPLKVRQDRTDGHEQGMVALAEKVEQHYTRPAPNAEHVEARLFPAPVMRRLAVGILAGALLGLLFGVLLFQSIVVVPGLEGLFSMGPFTFHVFWTLMGVSLGILLAGLATLASPGLRESS